MSDSLTEGMYLQRSHDERKEAERRSKLTQEEREDEDLGKMLTKAINISFWQGPHLLAAIREVIRLEVKRNTPT